MIADAESKLAPFDTAKESLTLIWAHLLPFVVLAMIFGAINMLAVGLGLFDDMFAFNRKMAEDGASVDWASLPMGDLLLALVVGFATLGGFGVFWYRYLLLGREGALKFGLGSFGRMLLRFTGYGLLVMTIWLLVFTMATAMGCLAGLAVGALLGKSGTFLAFVIQAAFVFVAYLWPLSFAARTSLVFPAIAVERPITLSQAWNASQEAGGHIVWAILFAMIPAVLMSLAVHNGLSALVGVDLTGYDSQTIRDFWWLQLLLAPVGNLTVAAGLGVVAIAYRELAIPEPACELGQGAGFPSGPAV